MTQPWIQTVKGRECNFDKLDDFVPDIEEIAHALSNLCRFTGHVQKFYSVAQHCCLVASHLPEYMKLTGLLHDAAEAYLGDVSTPLKRMAGLERYAALEDKLYSRVAATFGTKDPVPLAVKVQDRRALATEARHFFGVDVEKEWNVQAKPWEKTYIQPMTPNEARSTFLRMFKELTSGVSSGV